MGNISNEPNAKNRLPYARIYRRCNTCCNVSVTRQCPIKNPRHLHRDVLHYRSNAPLMETTSPKLEGRASDLLNTYPSYICLCILSHTHILLHPSSTTYILVSWLNVYHSRLGWLNGRWNVIQVPLTQRAIHISSVSPYIFHLFDLGSDHYRAFLVIGGVSGTHSPSWLSPCIDHKLVYIHIPNAHTSIYRARSHSMLSIWLTVEITVIYYVPHVSVSMCLTSTLSL